MKNETKKARGGRKVYKDLKITLTLTPEEWIALHRHYDDMKEHYAEQGKDYSWADYVDGCRFFIVDKARYFHEKILARQEVERARAAGFNVPMPSL